VVPERQIGQRNDPGPPVRDADVFWMRKVMLLICARLPGGRKAVKGTEPGRVLSSCKNRPDDPAIDPGQGMQFGYRHALVDLVHRLFTRPSSSTGQYRADECRCRWWF
jgi:hypothetical protein